jgi:hypothetical protein
MQNFMPFSTWVTIAVLSVSAPVPAVVGMVISDGNGWSGAMDRRGLLELERPEVDIVVGRQADRLAAVHGAAAADGDDPVVAARAEGIAARPDLVVTRVGGDVREDGTSQPGVTQVSLKFANEGQSAASTIGHDQRVAKPEPGAAITDFGKTSGAVGNRNRKRPVLEG